MILVAHQELTKEWWENRNRFDLFISEVVLNEISLGDPEAAKRRIDVITGIPFLELTEGAKEFAYKLIRLNLVPEKALADALHIVIAATTGMDYLLTWNCKHIANAVTRPKIENLCRDMEITPPVICIPEELLEI
ncbi:type II toxin-antitoxin system VapC family toxin [Candidatus Thiosymbion oneisti]|uniref:type II toxin-antitoxin system VapC family toxin n=1 Tax=Candidatus Thiosymbion oneisti TaxID=589554 RepID=UPI000A890072|nr:type II toxin-antitoxin system VapC family toxin [Candidatus Thiosymbion oneisti]